MMKVGLIYYTPHYHKLVEMTARECYQSYHKLSEESHNMIKAIMAKGHISIASVGNIVFGVTGFKGLEETVNVFADLLTMKEINNYIRWTLPDAKRNPDTKIGIIVSMNMLTFLDIHNNIDKYDVSSQLWSSMKKLFMGIPELAWFIDNSIELEPMENPYTSLGEPELYKPVLLTEDYTVLKEKGLTDYELDIHSTITLNFKVDRATGLQMWRHADMTGGTELSQRYVDRSNAEYRKMVDFEKGLYPENLKEKFEENYPDLPTSWAKYSYDQIVEDVYEKIEDAIESYTELRDQLINHGVRQGRAKEIARSILPNAITTKIIQCRPLRQWKHFLNLRDTVHAQKEIQKDAQAIKRVFNEVGIPYV